MNFTEEQAKAFWPVYRDYAHEQQEIEPRQTAKFYQVESRLNLLTNVPLASLVPIIR